MSPLPDVTIQLEHFLGEIQVDVIFRHEKTAIRLSPFYRNPVHNIPIILSLTTTLHFFLVDNRRQGFVAYTMCAS